MRSYFGSCLKFIVVKSCYDSHLNHERAGESQFGPSLKQITKYGYCAEPFSYIAGIGRCRSGEQDKVSS